MWVNMGTTDRNVWKDKTLKATQQAFLARFPRGLKPPTAQSLHLALVHIRNENGLLPNAADVHDEMDDEIYGQYFKDQILQNLSSN